MRGNMLVLLVFLGVFAQSTHADELIFKNGDRLTGKINHVVKGKLVFNSDVAGKMTKRECRNKRRSMMLDFIKPFGFI